MDEFKRSAAPNRKGPPTTSRPPTGRPPSPPPFDPLRFVAKPKAAKSREAMIAELAYFKAQSRGFEPGHEVADWLAAEAEIDKRSGLKA